MEFNPLKYNITKLKPSTGIRKYRENKKNLVKPTKLTERTKLPTFIEFLIENEKKQQFIAKQMGAKLTQAASRDAIASNTRGDPLEIMKQIAAMDPSGGKYLQFLARTYAAGEYSLGDDIRVRDALTRFNAIKNTLEKKDINQYPTIHEFFDAVEEDNVGGDTPQTKRQQRKQAKEGADIIVNTNNFKIARMKSAAAAKAFAAGTRWCTAYEDKYLYYSSKGALFVIQATDPDTGATRKYQLQYETNEIMDEKNRHVSPQDVAILSHYPQWYEFIDKLIQHHYIKLDDE